MEENSPTQRTTALPCPQTTVEHEDPMCTCCEPPQPLVSTGKSGAYECPVTGTPHTYDPAKGVARAAPITAPSASDAQPTTYTETTPPDHDMFPKAPPTEEIRRVDPTAPFA